jgi:hypothetical protein
MSLFHTLVEYFIYSHMPYFLYIAAMLCCSEDGEFLDEDFSRHVSPRSSALGVVFYSIVETYWSCNKHLLYCLFYYLSLYV